MFRSIVSLFAITLLLANAPLSAAVRTVGPVSCQYTDLASAVAAANSGDEIRIRYDYDAPTNVRIEKSLTLIGGLQDCFATLPWSSTQVSSLVTDPSAPRQVLDIRGNIVVKLFHLTLFGDDITGGLNIQDGAVVQVAGLTVYGGKALFGGGIWLHGSSTLQVIEAPFVSQIYGLSVAFSHASLGGGIYVGDGALLESLPGARYTTIWQNTAFEIGGNGGHGGGLYIQAGGSAVGDIDADNNVATRGGGAYVQGRATADVLATPDLQIVSLIANDATDGGGAYVAASEAAVVVIHSLRSNFAVHQGGGMWFGSDGYATASIVKSNESESSGGGVYQSAGWLQIDEELANNTAQDDGGGIYASGGQRGLGAGILISGNSATSGNGGALYDASGDVTILPTMGGDHCDSTTPCRITNNSAGTNGGAFLMLSGSRLWVKSQGTLESPGLIVSGNSAGTNGGALLAHGAELKFDTEQPLGQSEAASLWFDNSAAGDGGAIALYYGELTLKDAWLGEIGHPNTAGGTGGAAYISERSNLDGDLELTAINTHWIGNEANAGAAINLVDDARGTVTTSGCIAGALAVDRYCSEFLDNVAGNGGVVNIDGSLYIDSAAFLRNQAADSTRPVIRLSGGSKLSRFDNVLIANNTASGIEVLHASALAPPAPWLVSATLADNSGAAIRLADDIDISLSLFDSVLFGNAVSFVGLDGSAQLHAECSMAEGVTHPGIDDDDPLFITTPRGNYRLSPLSPAVGQCNDGPYFDLDGATRSLPTAMGAFEAVTPPAGPLFKDGFESP